MTSSPRRAYIDWARGLAVLVMIEAHTIDAWTRAEDKLSTAFGFLTVLGGFAAPLFLWLAGLGTAMSMERTLRRTSRRGDAVRSAIARGAEIFLLAFLFRVQAFVVSPGGHPIAIFKVDVLNVMGPAIAACGLLWVSTRRPAAQALVLSLAAAAIAMLTPVVRASPLVDELPVWLQWYVRPAGEFTTFTLLPWSGFVFAGAAAGVLLARPAGERQTLLALAATGAAIVGAGFFAASRPSIYSVPTFFWTSSPAWFAIRVGILMATLAALSWLPPSRLLEPLAVLGRASLFVYWIHVELVYGYASWLWRHRLPLLAWLPAYLAFAASMYGAVRLRDRVLARRGRRIPEPVAMSQA